MSDAVRVHEPTGDPIPLVLDSPHSGTDYPPDVEHAAPRAIVRQAEDTFVGELSSGRVLDATHAHHLTAPATLVNVAPPHRRRPRH